MIADEQESEKVVEQLTRLAVWLREVENSDHHPNKGLTKAGIHKMIARLHDELAIYDAEKALTAQTGSSADS